MLANLDNFYVEKQEPLQSCLLALREIIINYEKDITAEWKYRMPFFCYKGKMFCYLWVEKESGFPYIGFVEGKGLIHARLISQNRSRMKIILFDPVKDLPLKTISTLLKQALELYKSGQVKIKS